jgi:hypothetical protein
VVLSFSASNLSARDALASDASGGLPGGNVTFGNTSRANAVISPINAGALTKIGPGPKTASPLECPGFIKKPDFSQAFGAWAR